MQLKVLENTGTLTSASDGGAINFGITNRYEGIIRGRYDEFRDSYTSSSFSVFSGHYLCKGINLILEETATFNITPTSQTTTYIVGILAQAEQGNIISAEINIYSSSNIPTNTWSYNNSEFTGRFFIYLYRLTVNQTGLVTRADLRNYLQTYPSLYEYLIKISDNNYEGGVVDIFLTITTTLETLEGLTVDDFIESDSTYLGYGYVQASSGSSSYYEGPGLFTFNWGVQGESYVEDYRGGGLNFTMQGNENYEIISKRHLM